MTKPREKTREELTAEIEDGKKKIRQFENREKMLRQKLSKEERRTRSHRLIVRGAVFESIVPEAKDMTDEEAAALLRLALTSEPAREFLKKRAESGNAEWFLFGFRILRFGGLRSFLFCANTFTRSEERRVGKEC